MSRRIAAILASFALLCLAGCASTPTADAGIVYAPSYDGVYRLTYSASGSALYYRFYADGVVLSARTDAPAVDVLASLVPGNADASRGNWSAGRGELRIGVDEGTVRYDSRFDIRPDGRIALRGLPRAFEFIRTDDNGSHVAASR